MEGVGLPVAVRPRIIDWPTYAVALAGWEVIAAGAAGFTVRVAGALVTPPR
jgi:hypothetical protein